uniref:Uncharacterized protein n=1 Tax=Phlebotomus papatasi TaxID=29031 RepID=A0A1B0GPN8_PHLPP
MAYDFTMVHRAGNKMAHVDCLSRAPVEPPVEKDEVIILSVGLEEDDWVAASQLRDPVVSRIRDVLKGEGPRKYSKGDLVLLRYNPQATGSSRKLMPRYRGPYEVQKVLERDRYVIADTAVTQITQKRFPPTMYSAEKLIKFMEPSVANSKFLLILLMLPSTRARKMLFSSRHLFPRGVM